MADTMRLLPCPFCGEDAEHLTLRDNFGGFPRTHIIQCVRGCASAETDNLSPDEAVEAWNRRDRQGVTVPLDAEVPPLDDAAFRKIMSDLGRPESLSLYQALKQVENWATQIAEKRASTVLRQRLAELEARASEGRISVVTEEMIRAAACSVARDDEGEFPALTDLIDFSGENKTRAAIKKALEDALAAAPPAPSAWRTMDSAPENEEVIVATTLRVWPARRITKGGVERWFFTDEECAMTTPPTHWMPLPAPPVAEKAGEGAEGGRN